MSTRFFSISFGVVVALCAVFYFAGFAQTKSDEEEVSSADEQIEQKGGVPQVAVVYSDEYSIDLGGLEQFHPFDIHKYKKIVKQLGEDGVLKKNEIFEPTEISRKDILRVQSEAFLDSLDDKVSVIQYLEADALRFVAKSMLDSGVLKPFRFSAGGTLMAAEIALKNKSIAINIGGGFHHAKPDKGEGFCIYADIPIAIRKLQSQKKINRALIIDVDAHQGNGTVKCLEDDDSTFCFSMHQGDIYPLPKEKGDLDIDLEEGTDDEEFLKILKTNLPIIFSKSKPDIVFVVGGCDPLKGDPLAGLEMTPEGIMKRDQMIIDFARKKNVPIVLTMAGGYSKDAWKSQYESIKNILEKHGKRPLSKQPR